MTIYSVEKLRCRCQIKRYTGGTIVWLKDIWCKNPRHKNKTIYECGVCKKTMTKKELKTTHRWEHAI